MIIQIAFLSIIVYCVFIAVFFSHLKTHEPVQTRHHTPVSIICSARNEEENLTHFLNALLVQDYDLNLVQIIMVDDCSTDRTLDVLKSYQEKFPDFSCFTSVGREEAISAKKNALSQAMKKVKYDIVLSSDADCIPAKGWIKGIVDTYIQI